MAVPYLFLDDVVRNMIVQCDISAGLSDLITDLELFRVTHAMDLATPLVEHDRNLMLGIITGMTVATGTILNCYPRGAETALYFDIDGNPVPP